VNRKVLIAGACLVVPILAILVLNLGRDPHAVDSPLIGKPAPVFSLVPVGGGAPVSLADLRGKPVVINFWATWCVPCFEEHQVLSQTARAMAGSVHFLGVIYEDEESQVAGFLGKYGRAYPALMDAGSKTAIAYGVYGVPETYFIDPRGAIVDKFVGPLDAETLAQRIRMASK
jgi:cytochrome c biogenesis protein CcmG/thiol:disulfide interchange protein DsbE